MYAQVVRASVQPGKIDELITIFRDGVIPAALVAPGFRKAFMFVDRASNRGMGVSLWETEADVTALATSGFYQEQVGKLAGVLAEQPDRGVYELVFEA